MKDTGLKYLSGGGLLLILIYILAVLRPEFYFHHQQSAFICSPEFLLPYLNRPGGVSELAAAFLMQFFRLPVWGGLAFFTLGLVLALLTNRVLQQLHPHTGNRVLALLPMALMVGVVNHYNFPFSTLVSLLTLMFLLPILLRIRKTWQQLLGVSLAFFLILYMAGSSFALLLAILLLLGKFHPRKVASWGIFLWVLLLAAFTLLSGIAPGLRLFPEALYFRSYQPGTIFFCLMATIPLLILCARLGLLSISIRPSWLRTTVVLVGLAAFLFGVHHLSYLKDARKVVAADYFAYKGQDANCRRVLNELQTYSMAANLNFNLAHLKAGTLSDHFFEFLQISGYQSLQPDFEFSSELAFISAEYYYELGFITEARHWAYEALVFFPYSQRALILLAKTHLVCGEYEAARSCLHLLDRGLGNRNVIRELSPLVAYPDLLSQHPEFSRLRKHIPEEKELNPYIHGRLLELLEADPGNRQAFEVLLLYYMLDGQLERVLEHLAEAPDFFTVLPGIFQEAILILGEKEEQPAAGLPEVGKEAQHRHAEFRSTQQKHSKPRTRARNILYWGMGKTYLYYHSYVLPRIVIPELAEEAYEEAPI